MQYAFAKEGAPPRMLKAGTHKEAVAEAKVLLAGRKGSLFKEARRRGHGGHEVVAFRRVQAIT